MSSPAEGRIGPVAALIIFTVCHGLMAQKSATATSPKKMSYREPLVIQGQITEIQDKIITVKTPDGYPGGTGVHAKFVALGPAFQIDVSHARVLLPDGQQPDPTQQFSVGDRVVAVLPPSKRDAGSIESGAVARAIILERIVTGNKIVTH